MSTHTKIFKKIIAGDYSEAEIIEAFTDNNMNAFMFTDDQLAVYSKIVEPLRQVALKKLEEAPSGAYDQLYLLLDCQKSLNQSTANRAWALISKIDIWENPKIFEFEIELTLNQLERLQFSDSKNFSNATMRLFLDIVMSAGYDSRDLETWLCYFINCQNSDKKDIKDDARELALKINVQSMRSPLKSIIGYLDNSTKKIEPRMYFKKGGPDAVRLAIDLLFKIEPHKFQNDFEFLIDSQELACPNTRYITEQLALRLAPNFLENKLFYLIERCDSASANVRILASKLALLIPPEKIYGANLNKLISIIKESNDINVISLAQKIALKVSPKILAAHNRPDDFIFKEGMPAELKDLMNGLATLVKSQIIRTEKVEELKKIISL